MAKLLFIGGTRFLGYYATEAALARGHEVTHFNRGKSDAAAFPGVETIRGDRASDLELLKSRQWDAVIDTSGYLPKVVRKSAEALAGSVGLYIFISSISAYAQLPPEGVDEDSPLEQLDDWDLDEMKLELYGPLKAACEAVVQESVPGRALVVRPGLLVGPRDPTDRFNYWVRRIARGGEMLAPGTPGDVVQFIDVRDLGEWLVSMAEKQRPGTFNATGPAQPLTMGEYLERSRSALGSDARFTWVDSQFLLEREVAPWSELPLWMPEEILAIHSAKIGRALAERLTFRPVEETVRDTWTFMQTNPEKAAPQGSLTAEREQQLLAEWQGQGNQ